MNKKEIKELKKFQKRLGYRKNFNFYNRFHLVDIVGDYKISTVDLGLNHNLGIGKPLYYETMIFDEKNNDTLDYQVRYSTKFHARIGHKKAIRYVKKNIIRE